MDDEKKRIMSVFAHPDDELGAIGTLVNHADRGDEVTMIWTTYGELTTHFPDLSPTDVKKERKRHGEEIAKIVGAKADFLDLGDSFVDLSRPHRVALATKYIEYKPDLVVTWDVFNLHPDHRNTGQLAIDAIKFARINSIVNSKTPHRKNVVLLSYFSEYSRNPKIFIDVTENMEKVKDTANFYAQIYNWKNVNNWIVRRRSARGIECGANYAEKFNIRFSLKKPDKYAI